MEKRKGKTVGNLCTVSMIGGVMIIVIIGLRALLQNRLHRTVFLLLWLLTAIRLAFPMMISSSVSVYNFLPQRELFVISDERVSGRSENVRHAPENAVYEEDTPVSLPSSDEFEDYTAGGIAPVEVSPLNRGDRDPLSVEQILTIVWGIGCGISFLYFMWIHIRGRLRYRFALPEEGPAFLGNIRLKRSDAISSPLVYGFFRPVILLPYDFPKKNSPEYDQVLYHELTHVHSGDLWYKLLMLLVTCIHWFNPLIWIMLHLSTQDLEIRCDARVIRKLGKKKVYAMTLVQAELRRSTHFVEAAFAFSLTELRLKSIAKAKVYLPRSIFLFAVLAVVLVCCFSTGPSAKATIEPTARESIPIESEHTIATEQITEEITEATTEATEAAEVKPSPIISVSKDEELAYLLSCGFEEYGSTMELSIKEGQKKTISLKLPNYATFSVDPSENSIANIRWEYSSDEELFYMTVDTYDEGEERIYISVAERLWMTIRVKASFDPYYEVPDGWAYMEYGSEMSIDLTETLFKTYRLDLPERTTYSAKSYGGHMLPWETDLLQIKTWYDYEEECLMVRVQCNKIGYGEICFYIDGIYWCKMDVAIGYKPIWSNH